MFSLYIKRNTSTNFDWWSFKTIDSDWTIYCLAVNLIYDEIFGLHNFEDIITAADINTMINRDGNSQWIYNRKLDTGKCMWVHLGIFSSSDMMIQFRFSEINNIFNLIFMKMGYLHTIDDIARVRNARTGINLPPLYYFILLIAKFRFPCLSLAERSTCPHHRRHSCWWFSDTSSQGISRHGIE